MKVALIGAELEENIGLRYMASALEQRGHEALIIPFNFDRDRPQTVEKTLAFDPHIVGLSMVFTGRAREFCKLANSLRDKGCQGHIIAHLTGSCISAATVIALHAHEWKIGDGLEFMIHTAKRISEQIKQELSKKPLAMSTAW